MPNPLGTEFLSIPLTNFGAAQMQEAQNFLARRLLTKIPVAQQTAPYYVYPSGDWLRNEAKPLGRGAESAGGGWHLSDDTYSAIVYAFHKDNDMQDYANANAAGIMNLDQDATQYTTEKIQILEDSMFASRFMPDAGGVWDSEFTGVAGAPGAGQFLQWDDPDSTPVDDISNEIVATARRNVGRKPNILVVSPTVYQALRRNQQVIDLYQFSTGGVVTDAQLDAALGVHVEVAWAVVNNAAEGLADDVDFIFGDNALLAYLAPAGGPKTNTAAGMFTWTAMDGGSAIGSRVDRIPAPLIHSIRIEAMAAFDMKVINAAAATEFIDCTSL